MKIYVIVKNGKVCDTAAQALRKCLEDVPFLEEPRINKAIAQKLGVDLVVKVGSGEGRTSLLIEVNSNGELRYARMAALRLTRAVAEAPSSYGVFMAPYISPRTASLCEEEGIGYIDFAGNCRLAFDNVFIRQEGKPNPITKRKSSRTIYSPKASRVLRILLLTPLRPWKLQSISDEGEVSIGHVSNVKQALLDRELAADRPDGLIVTEPAAILNEWVEHYGRYRGESTSTRSFYSLLTPREIEERLSREAEAAGTGSELPAPALAFTDFSAADRVAPFVRYQRVTAYTRVRSMVDYLVDRLNLHTVETGANVEIAVPYDQGVFIGARRQQGAWIVDPLQLYLDLTAKQGRGDEAAEFVLNKVLLPAWKG